jgi:glutamate 5-kinase
VTAVPEPGEARDGAGWRSRDPRRRRVVLKLGSRLLTGGTPALLPERIRMYAAAVARNRAVETVIVSSGAVAAGYPTVGCSTVPGERRKRQAAAAVGQSLLMRTYAEAFAEHGIAVGQVLLTGESIRDRRRYVNARNAFAALFAAGVVPIVNENDAVTSEDCRVGDNDNLAAYTAALVDADLLVLFTDVPGVFDRDPSAGGASVIPFAASAEELRRFCYRKRSAESRGGMHTKLEAAEKAGRYGVPTVIASGLDPETVDAVYAGRPTGTRIAPYTEPLNAHQHWMAVQDPPAGQLLVDDGALAAIRAGSSLLARGVVRGTGRFTAGSVVSIVDTDGVERARGLTRFDDREIERIAGCHSSEIEGIVGYRAGTTVVRSDKLVMLERT